MSETLFDTRTGGLVDRETIEADGINSDTAALLSVSGLLRTHDFPFHAGDFPIDPPAQWPRERCIEAGRLAVSVLLEPAPGERVGQSMEVSKPAKTPRLTREHAERLYVLGHFPSRFTIRREFGSLSGLGQAAEIRMSKNTLYDNWPLAEYVKYAHSLATGLRRKPREPDYEALAHDGKGPTLYQIAQRVGGIRKLNELIGYPNIHSWNEEDYLQWGVRVEKANRDGVLTARLITVLSKKKRGPSVSTLENKFDDLGVFQEKVAEHRKVIDANERRHYMWLGREYRELERRGLGLDLAPNTIRNNKHIQPYTAKFLVAQRCVPGLNPRAIPNLAIMPLGLFQATLQDLVPILTIEDIENAAQELHVAKNLWPLEEWKRYLWVSRRELGYVRAGNEVRFTGEDRFKRPQQVAPYYNIPNQP
ncbi:MAG TPA: hypothetical protein VLF59_03330 [Candidatus Saccharimonadales bacterium]|nr:hypothetical protein [Candidatus Saccharimonadales bacterium]